MNSVYALLTRHCNLTCPYCDVKDTDDEFDINKFTKELINFQGSIILFGGEPTLYRDRLKSVLYNPDIFDKIGSITSNLMVIDDELINIFQCIPRLATSWNPARFRNGEYEIWKHNLDLLEGHKELSVLITMTYELLDMSPAAAADTISTWNRNVVSSIMFENLVDDKIDKEYFMRVDDWLCELFDYADRLPIIETRLGFDQVRCFDCSNTYTLEPNGHLRHGCPHEQRKYVPDECYACELSEICQPCILQKYCSIPKKLYGKLYPKE